MFETVMDLEVTSTPTQTFDHIARGFFEHHSLWDPSVTSMTKSSDGPVGVGTRGLEHRRLGPWSITSQVEVTEFEPVRRFGFRTTSGPMGEGMDVTIEERVGGSSVRMHLRLSPNALMLRLLEPVMRPLFARNVRRNGALLVAAVNGAAGPAAAVVRPSLSPDTVPHR
jgi:hypothetical protein